MLNIKTNISSINARRIQQKNNAKNTKASKRLSSGLKINTAADDAAGLAISSKMKAKVKGLQRADQNVLEGMDLVRTAEGGMAEITNLLQREYELVINALNDVNSTSDREKIQFEIDQITEQIDTVANYTEYNGMKLLSNYFNKIEDKIILTDDAIYTKLNVSVSSPPVDNNGKFTNFGALNNEGSYTDILYENAQHTLVKIEVPSNDPSIGSEIVVIDIKGTNGGTSLNATCNGTTYNSSNETWTTTWNYISIDPFIDITFTQDVNIVEVYNNSGDLVGERYNIQTATTNNASTDIKATTLISYDIDISGAGVNPDFKIDGNITSIDKNNIYTTLPTELEVLHESKPELKLSAIMNPTGTDNINAVYIGNYTQVGATNGTDFIFSNYIGSSISDSAYAIVYEEQTLSSGQSTSQTNQLGVTDPRDWNSDGSDYIIEESVEEEKLGDLHIQAGSDSNQSMWINRYDCSTRTLGISSISVLDRTTAENDLKSISFALEQLASFRANAGAQMNSLEYTSNNINSAATNLAAAKSRIEDADMAKEMIEFTRSNIINQAATSIIAQANQSASSVLELLN